MSRAKVTAEERIEAAKACAEGKITPNSGYEVSTGTGDSFAANKLSDCVDEDGDGKCDICGKAMGGVPVTPVKSTFNPIKAIVKTVTDIVVAAKTASAVKAVAVVKGILGIFR